ncbi:hypothetical protein F4802DRAFT_595601 [Xylaria palmicola]|nr:hypothetical protein F4802DRAFT_595601 [Xylaria palmicola]
MACFDYDLPSCRVDIRAWIYGRLAHVFDRVKDAATVEMCYSAIGSAGGMYSGVHGYRPDLYGGEPLKLAGVYGRPASPDARAFASRLFEMAEKLLGDDEIKNHPPEIRSGGLGALAGGIEELRMGRVRARKLVYSLLA